MAKTETKENDAPAAVLPTPDAPVINSADELFSLNDVELVALRVPIWNRTVYVRPLKGSELDEINWEEFNARQIYLESKNNDQLALYMKTYRQKLLVKTLCKPEGTRLFEGMDQYKAMEKLADKNAAALEWIAIEVQKLNRIRDEDIAVLAKNSTSGQNGGSSSN